MFFGLSLPNTLERFRLLAFSIWLFSAGCWKTIALNIALNPFPLTCQSFRNSHLSTPNLIFCTFPKGRFSAPLTKHPNWHVMFFFLNVTKLVPAVEVQKLTDASVGKSTQFTGRDAQK